MLVFGDDELSCVTDLLWEDYLFFGMYTVA